MFAAFQVLYLLLPALHFSHLLLVSGAGQPVVLNLHILYECRQQQKHHYRNGNVVSFAFISRSSSRISLFDVDGTSCWDDVLECVDDGVMIVRSSKDEDKASEAGIER